MRRAPPLLLAALLLSCVQENPEDAYYWLGRVSDAEGAPRAGAAVTLGSSPSAGVPACSPTGRTRVRSSPDGYALVPASYRELRQATAGEDGAFYFDLLRFEIAPTTEPRCFSVSARGAGGSTASSAAKGEAKDLEFPDLAQWEPAFAVQPDSPARVALPALPWTPSRDGTQEVEPGHTRRVYYDWLVSGPGGELAWQRLTESDPLTLEPEVLEDFPGLSASLEAWRGDVVEVPGLLGITDVLKYWSAVRTPSLALSAGSSVPVSRGAPCTFNGAPYSGCPLTDGSLELAVLPSWYQPADPHPGDPEAARDRVVIALSRPAVPRLLVMRDIHSNFGDGPGVKLAVEGSADEVNWFPLVGEEFVTVAPTVEVPDTSVFFGSGTHVWQPLDSGGQAVRQIRLSTPPYFSFLAAREISVFE